MTETDRITPQPWMTAATTRAVVAALEQGGQAARFVGGCVRDAILGRPIADIDIATPLAPQDAMAALVAAGIKVVPTGLAHGTITAVVPPDHFEITTLRHDVETDGRRAKVAFTDDWAADARRRDFTMNALFLDASGAIFDPVGGLPDLEARRVRFVGEPDQRIREDVLRILRFYRFHARYEAGTADPAARSACAALAHLLPTLSGERVATESLKLLRAPDPVPTLRLMIEDGVLAHTLPDARRLDRLAGVVALEDRMALPADPIRRLAALLPDDADIARALADRLRLSNEHRDRLIVLAAPPARPGGTAVVNRQALRRLGVDCFRDLVLLEGATSGDAASTSQRFAEAAHLAPPPFPLKGRDARALGIAAGPAIGQLLGEVEAWWEAADYRPGRTACLARLKDAADKFRSAG